MEWDFSYVRCLGLCFVGIINNKIGYLAAILGFICANEVGKAAGWH